MSRKKIVISALCMVSLLAMPVQAAVSFCTHPDMVKSDRAHHGYKTNSYQHQEWMQEVKYECASCGEDVVLGNIQYLGDWENHDWRVDKGNPDDRGGGLIYYDAWCTTCGYEDILSNYEIEDLGL